MDWITILTSVVTASLISSIFILLNDHLRRKSEEKRFMLETALKLTELRNDQILQVLKRTDRKIRWAAPVNTFNKTLKMVKDIWEGKYKEPDKPPMVT